MLPDIERSVVEDPSTAIQDDAGADATLAGLVRQTLIELARYSPGYAKHFADRAGARLAYHVSAGQIERLSPEGRSAMQEVYVGMQAALTVEPGLDTNALRERLAQAHH